MLTAIITIALGVVAGVVLLVLIAAIWNAVSAARTERLIERYGRPGGRVVDKRTEPDVSQAPNESPEEFALRRRALRRARVARKKAAIDAYYRSKGH